MFSVPDGRAANQPLAVQTLTPPIAAPLSGAWVCTASIVSPASSRDVICELDSRDSICFSAGVAGASKRS